MRRDPLIIGGGPAGCAAAIALGRAGSQPILIERATGPADKVCGDFLGGDSIGIAEELGVDPIRLGAVPIHRFRLTKGRRSVEASLPFRAAGLTRRALDAALLDCAVSAGARVRTGQTVRHLVRDAAAWRAETDLEAIEADSVFLATGKHELRDLPRRHDNAGFVGMKTYLELTSKASRRLDGVTELVLFAGGYAGLQHVEGGKSVLCVAVDRTAFRTYGSTWAGMIASIEASSEHFRSMMAGSRPLLPRPLAVAGIPYGYLINAAPAVGLYRLGDQAAVIPSLTGDGVAIALHSGQRAASAWLGESGAGFYQDRLVRTLMPQMRLAGWLQRAGLREVSQILATHLLRWFPGCLRHAARSTRLRSALGGPDAGAVATLSVR